MDKELLTMAKITANKLGRNYDERQEIEGLCLEVIWKLRPRVAGLPTEKSYLQVCMENAGKKHLQKIRAIQFVEYGQEAAETILDPINYEVQILEQLALKDLKIGEALAKMKPAKKKIINLLMEGKSYEEIAEETGKTVNAIRVTVHRNKVQFKSLFEKHEED